MERDGASKDDSGLAADGGCEEAQAEQLAGHRQAPGLVAEVRAASRAARRARRWSAGFPAMLIFGALIFGVAGLLALRSALDGGAPAQAPEQTPSLGSTGAGEPRVERVRGAIRLDADRNEILADLELEVVTAGRRVITLDAPAGWVDKAREAAAMRWVQLSSDGVDCAYQQIGEQVRVELPLAAARVRLSVRYHGAPGAGDDAYFFAQRAFFRDAAPSLPGSLPAFDVDVAYREHDLERDAPSALPDPPSKHNLGQRAPSLLSALRLDDEPGAPGAWVTARLHAEAGQHAELGFAFAPFRLVQTHPLRLGMQSRNTSVARIYRALDSAFDGLGHRRLELPDHEAPGDAEEAISEHENDVFYDMDDYFYALTHEKMTVSLEPQRSVRIAFLRRRGAPPTALLEGFALLDANALMSYELEIVRIRFAVRDLVRDAASSAGGWSEAVADMLHLASLLGNRGEPREKVALAQYDEVEQDVAITSREAISSTDRKALDAKAVLVLRAFEVVCAAALDAKRASAPDWTQTMRALKKLLERHRGETIGWEPLLEELGRELPEETAFLRGWLERPGAPALELVGEVEADGKFHGAVVQSFHDGHPEGAPYFPGVVQIVADDEEYAAELSKLVLLTGRRTEVILDVKRGARSKLELDPSSWFPRRLTVHRAGFPPRPAVTTIALRP